MIEASWKMFCLIKMNQPQTKHPPDRLSMVGGQTGGGQSNGHVTHLQETGLLMYQLSIFSLRTILNTFFQECMSELTTLKKDTFVQEVHLWPLTCRAFFFFIFSSRLFLFYQFLSFCWSSFFVGYTRRTSPFPTPTWPKHREEQIYSFLFCHLHFLFPFLFPS